MNDAMSDARPNRRELVARTLLRTRGAQIATDDNWPRSISQYRELCEKTPGLAYDIGIIGPALREADAVLAALRMTEGDG